MYVGIDQPGYKREAWLRELSGGSRYVGTFPWAYLSDFAVLDYDEATLNEIISSKDVDVLEDEQF